jgi:site-specific DNA recombinase
MTSSIGVQNDGVESVDKPRVIVSVRVSSKHQQEQGFGHANQLRMLPALVAEQGWEIARRPDGSPGIYDEGFASTTAAAGDDLSLESRPVMQQLLGELSHVQPRYLVCRELDRLHRDTLEWELMQHQLVRAGVEGIVQWPSLQGMPMVTRLDESKDRAFASIQAVFASLQKADMKAKLGAGRRERAAQGLPYGGQVPYGYDRVPKGPFLVNEAQAETYNQIMDWVIEGLGAKAIATRLTRQGISSPRGMAHWIPSTVAGLIESRAQLGMVRTRRDGVDTWVVARDQQPIITRERWEQAQAVLGSRKRYSDQQRRHALAGLLKCSACGYTLRYTVQRRLNAAGERQAYSYYKCEHNRACTGRYAIAERIALKEIAEQVNERLRDTTHWTQPAPAGQIGEVEQRISELETAAADALRKVKRANTAWVDADEAMAGIALEELHTRQQTLKTIQTELDEARQGYAQAMTAPSDAVDLDEIRALLLGWEALPDEEKRMVLAAVIDHAVVVPKGRGPRLDIHWLAAPKLPEHSTGI